MTENRQYVSLTYSSLRHCECIVDSAPSIQNACCTSCRAMGVFILAPAPRAFPQEAHSKNSLPEMICALMSLSFLALLSRDLFYLAIFLSILALTNSFGDRPQYRPAPESFHAWLEEIRRLRSNSDLFIHSDQAVQRIDRQILLVRTAPSETMTHPNRSLKLKSIATSLFLSADTNRVAPFFVSCQCDCVKPLTGYFRKYLPSLSLMISLPKPSSLSPIRRESSN